MWITVQNTGLATCFLTVAMAYFSMILQRFFMIQLSNSCITLIENLLKKKTTFSHFLKMINLKIYRKRWLYFSILKAISPTTLRAKNHCSFKDLKRRIHLSRSGC